MSVRRWLVSSFALRPSGASFFHQIDNATTTPRRAPTGAPARPPKDPPGVKNPN